MPDAWRVGFFYCLKGGDARPTPALFFWPEDVRKILKGDRMTLLTPHEVALQLKVADRTVIRYLNNGGLKGFKLDKNWRTTEEFLNAFLRARWRG